MSRRNRAKKRSLIEDRLYNSKLITMLINNIMLDGKKTIAEKIVYSSLDRIKSKYKMDKSIDIFNKAMENLRTEVELRTVRVGGANYQVPVPVDYVRANRLAVKWLIDAATARAKKPMYEKLADEIYDAYDSKGGAIKKRSDIVKMAVANKAFAHYARNISSKTVTSNNQ